jgi:hypothetical protein
MASHRRHRPLLTFLANQDGSGFTVSAKTPPHGIGLLPTDADAAAKTIDRR